MTHQDSKKDPFPMILSGLLVGAVILAVISYLLGLQLQTQTYLLLKGMFFTPLKQWIFPVIGASMFSIFFRSPTGKASKFFILLVDILLLYLLSTFIADIYAYLTFPLFPFVESVLPLMGDAKETVFTQTSQKGLPVVIWVMIIGVLASVVFRYVLFSVFATFSKFAASGLVKLSNVKYIRSISFVQSLKSDFEQASTHNSRIEYCLSLINFIESFIFKVLMLILLMAPLAVFSSFLEMLNERGFVFFADLGKFIVSYCAILLSYQFLITPLVRNIFCYGVKGETYGSFITKSLPVIATAGTTSSSVATLAANIKAAQSLNVEEDMKGRGHNRALMPIGATFNMDGTSISLVIYFLLAANLAGMDVNFWWVILTAVTLSVGTAAVPSASLIMLTSMYATFSIPAAITGKLLSIIIAVDPIHDRVRTIVNAWGDLNAVYIVQSKRGMASIVSRLFSKKSK